MRAVAFSTMQGPLSRTHSTVPLAGGAPSSLSPLRRRHTIRRHVDHHQRRLLTPPSHASTPFSKEQQQQQQHQQQHGEEGSTEAEEAAEAVAKAVRKGVVSVIFLITGLGASSLEKDSKPLATSFFSGKKKKQSHGAPFDWLAHWYPVALESATPKDRPTAVKLLGRDLVLWHDGGAWRCFEDRCPHRAVPLSEGRVETAAAAAAAAGGPGERRMAAKNLPKELQCA